MMLTGRKCPRLAGKVARALGRRGPRPERHVKARRHRPRSRASSRTRRRAGGGGGCLIELINSTLWPQGSPPKRMADRKPRRKAADRAFTPAPARADRPVGEPRRQIRRTWRRRRSPRFARALLGDRYPRRNLGGACFFLRGEAQGALADGGIGPGGHVHVIRRPAPWGGDIAGLVAAWHGFIVTLRRHEGGGRSARAIERGRRRCTARSATQAPSEDPPNALGPL